MQKAMERELNNADQFDCPLSAQHYQEAYEARTRTSDLVCMQQALERGENFLLLPMKASRNQCLKNIRAKFSEIKCLRNHEVFDMIRARHGGPP